MLYITHPVHVVLPSSLYSTTTKLERHTILTITMKITSEMAEMMGDVESAGIKIDWMDRLIEEIHNKRECKILCKVNTLRA